MKIFLLAIFAFVAYANGQIQTKYFSQPVDHFSINDNRAFATRYHVNSNLYREHGPIFIYIQFGNVSTQYILEGNMHDLAKEEGALLIALETRYYGESLPTIDASLENLQWLNIHQMVADFGRFASFIKEEYSNAPIILWAFSHGAALVSWTRQKYPNVIDGAWGSSASVNIIAEDMHALPNIRRLITQFGGDDCMKIIENALSLITASIRSGNVSFIEDRFKSCGPLDANNDDDITRFLLTIELDIATSLSSYDKIAEMCSIIQGYGNPLDDPIENFANWYIDEYQRSRGITCSLSSNEEYARLRQDPSWYGVSVINWERQSMWLRCTQFGLFTTNEDRYSLPFFRKTCATSLGSDIFLQPMRLPETIEKVKSEFGSLNQVTRLLLTQGELDAYKSLGPSHDLNPQSPVIIIPGERLKSDLGAPDKAKDSKILYDIKLRIQETIHQWIERARLGEREAERPNVSNFEKVTLYSLILALFVIVLFSIWCATRLFMQCKQARLLNRTILHVEPGKSYEAKFG